MSKRIDVSYDLTGDVESVYAAISSDRWASVKAEQLKDGSRQESRTVSDGDAVTLVVSRALPDGVPGFLEKFLPASGRATQTEAWAASDNGSRRGTWKADIPGAPANAGGTMSLTPTSTGTRYTVQGEVKVAIPLIGGKAESFIVDMIGKLTAKEAEVLQTLV